MKARSWRDASTSMEADDAGITEAIRQNQSDLRAEGIDLDTMIACGAEGCVFRAGPGRVAKITTSKDEAVIARFLGGEHASLPRVFKIGRFRAAAQPAPMTTVMFREACRSDPDAFVYANWYFVIREDLPDIPSAFAARIHAGFVGGRPSAAFEHPPDVRRFNEAWNALVKWLNVQSVQCYDMGVRNWGQRKGGTFVLRDLGGLEPTDHMLRVFSESEGL